MLQVLTSLEGVGQGREACHEVETVIVYRLTFQGQESWIQGYLYKFSVDEVTMGAHAAVCVKSCSSHLASQNSSGN